MEPVAIAQARTIGQIIGQHSLSFVMMRSPYFISLLSIFPLLSSEQRQYSISAWW
jgi:hypothetical protein